MLKKVRQLIESVNDTLKGQLDLEQHGAHSIEGASVRIAQRTLALTTAIWHNSQTNQPTNHPLPHHPRPLTALRLPRLATFPPGGRPVPG